MSEDIPASITAEASFVLPLLLIFLRILIGMFSVLETQFVEYAAADAQAEKAAIASFYDLKGSAAAVTQGSDKTDAKAQEVCICVSVTADDEFAGRFFGSASMVTVRRSWTGRFLPKGGESIRYVIVAENGTVCHLTESCTYLSLSVRQICFSALTVVRNDSGHRYLACEKCAQSQNGGVCYITDNGLRYHSDRNCSGLKRTWRWVDVRECGLPLCSRCGR